MGIVSVWFLTKRRLNVGAFEFAANILITLTANCQIFFDSCPWLKFSFVVYSLDMVADVLFAALKQFGPHLLLGLPTSSVT
ncbi:hypothetical protein SAMN06295888_10119 [Desulfonatronum zhilinae]|nr:hypothetical protein SAMN06295888_10119 [Desulfonatronum zhilinae]